MAKKSIPANFAQAALSIAAAHQATKVRGLSNRIDRASLLVGYTVVIADVLTMCQSNAEFAEQLDKSTLVQLPWLQKELAEQAVAVLDGYMEPEIPTHESRLAEAQA